MNPPQHEVTRVSRRRIALVVIAALVVVAAAATAIALVAVNAHTASPTTAGPVGGGRFGGFPGGGQGRGFAVTSNSDWTTVPWVGLTGFALGALCVLFIVMLTGSFRHASAVSATGTAVRSAASDELDMRYARGEVEREEYLLRRGDLVGAPTGGA